MNVLRITALVAVCSAALSAAGQSKALESSAAKPTTQQQDIPSSIADSVSGTLQLSRGFLGLRKPCREPIFFVPTAGKFDDVRTFGEQVKHVACAQFAFFNEFEGKKPPKTARRVATNGANETRIDQISQGFVRLLKPCPGYLTPKNALERVEGRYAGPNTKLGISVVAVWHITDHYGQLVEYLRMNGIVPPMTQQYGVKVR